MPEAMRDPMAKWTPAQEWSAARLTRPGWSAAWVGGLHQTLISGDLEAAFSGRDRQAGFVGLWAIARLPAAIRIGRDRALLVSAQAYKTSWGWRDEGFAATDASDAYAVLSLAGPELRAIAAEATSADIDVGSPSAAIQFAGVAALLYRIGEAEAHLHVETSFASYVWRWLETR